MAQRALAEVAECVHLGVGVVDAFNHGEFVGWPSTSLLGVQLQRLMEANERVLLNARHELVSGALDGRVKRNGKGELFRQIGKSANVGNDSAGRHRKVTRANIEAVLAVEHAEGAHRFVEVGKRLSLSHKDDARNTLAKVSAHVNNLVDHFLRGKRARKASKAGGAERAAHVATGLRGDANRKAIARGHSNRFDGNAVGELEEVLSRAILRNLFDHLCWHSEDEVLGKLLAERFGKVGHLFKRTYVLFKEPFVELLGTKRRLAKLAHYLRKFLRGKGSDVGKMVGALHTRPFCETFDSTRVQVAYIPIQ